MLAGEVPYVIAFLALVVLAFWLVGRAADRGWFDRPVRPGALLVLAALFVAQAIFSVRAQDWWWAAFFVFGALCYVASAWRRRRHPDAPRR